MARQIDYAQRALDDLAAAAAWLTQPGSGKAAHARLAAIYKSVEHLRVYPCLYPAAGRRGVREMTCGGGYRVIYRVSADTGRNDTAGDVLVLRIFGPRQDRRTP